MWHSIQNCHRCATLTASVIASCVQRVAVSRAEPAPQPSDSDTAPYLHAVVQANATDWYKHHAHCEEDKDHL